MLNKYIKKEIRKYFEIILNTNNDSTATATAFHYRIEGMLDVLYYESLITTSTYSRYTRINNKIGGYNRKIISYKGH